MTSTRNLGNRILIAFLAVVVAASLIEMGAAVAYHFQLPEQTREAIDLAIGAGSSWSHTALARYQPHPSLQFVGNPQFRLPDGSRIFNPQGFRDTGVDWMRKSPGAVRLVAIGGSTTFGFLFRDARDVWPSILGERLKQATGRRVEVLNAGLPGYNSYNLVAFCAFWLPELSADVVVVHSGFNDAFAAAYPDEGGPAGEYFNRPFQPRRLSSASRMLLRASHVARLLSLKWLGREGFLAGDLVAATILPVPSDRDIERFASASTGHYFARNLRTIIGLIRAAGALPLITNEPMNPQREKGQGPYYGAAFEAARRNTGIAAEVASAEGATFVDLHTMMRDPSDYVDPIHLNQQGMRTKAALLLPSLKGLIAP